MVKNEGETFKEYAQCWKGVAAQVEPLLSEKEIMKMFIDTLQVDWECIIKFFGPSCYRGKS